VRYVGREIHVDVAPSAKSCTALDPYAICLDTLLLQPDFPARWGFFNLRLMELGFLGDDFCSKSPSSGARLSAVGPHR